MSGSRWKLKTLPFIDPVVLICYFLDLLKKVNSHVTSVKDGVKSKTSALERQRAARTLRTEGVRGVYPKKHNLPTFLLFSVEIFSNSFFFSFLVESVKSVGKWMGPAATHRNALTGAA